MCGIGEFLKTISISKHIKLWLVVKTLPTFRAF